MLAALFDEMLAEVERLAAHPAPVAAQPSQAPVVQAGDANAPAVRMLTEDEVAQATEDGERSFRRWTQGVRGQTLMPQDSPTFHYVMAGAAKALAAFRAAIIADLAADVEQDGFRLVSVNVGFTELMEALDRADRKGYMPDAICNAYEGFEYRDPASTVAALKARVAVLEESASQFAGVDLDGMVEAFHRIIESQAQQSPFHNPVNADAALALRELRRLIPAMKAVALTKGQP